METENDVKSFESDEISAILDHLKPQYQRFVRHYCQYLSKTAAAIAAGYAEASASVTGFHIYNRPEIRKAITEYFRATEFIPEDNIAGIKRMAELDMSLYFTVQETWIVVRRKVPIAQLIAQVAYDYKLEDAMLMDSTNLLKVEKTMLLQKVSELENKLRKLRKEQKLNPKAEKFMTFDELKQEKVLDIDKVIADKVPIKAIKYKETGIELELYSALDAKRDLARVAGSFEKDNVVKLPSALLAPTVNVYNGTTPPMAEDETQIDLKREDV